MSRAIILGGGGVAGIAWESGILKGVEDSGISLADADAIIGSSAGAFAGTYLAAGVVGTYYDTQFSDDVSEVVATMSPESAAAYQEALIAGGGDAVATGRALGAMALKAKTVSSDARRKVIESRLPSTEWPTASLKMTAIDASSGELHILDKSSGIPLYTAAAATGAVPGLYPVVKMNGRSWIDGGSFSGTNAHLGRDFETVVVIAPFPVGLPGMPTVHSDVDALIAAGRNVFLITPDEASIAAMGVNPFDPARRGPSASAGLAQSLRLVSELEDFWA